MSVVSRCFHYTKADSAIKILETGKFKFSKLDGLNDPFDAEITIFLTKKFDVCKFLVQAKALLSADTFAALYSHASLCENKLKKERRDNFQDNITATFKNIRQMHDRHVRLISCSMSDDIPSMWSHYAGKNTGVVMEFKEVKSGNEQILKINKDTNDNNRMIEKVRYRKSPPSHNETKLIEFFVANEKIAKLLKDDQAHTTMELFLKTALFNKSKHWKYENELRIIQFLTLDQNSSNDYYESVSSSNLKKLILGNRISENDEKAIIKLVKSGYDGVQIYKQTGFRNGYKYSKRIINL